METKLVLELSNLIYGQCKDVPHNMESQLREIVKAFLEKEYANSTAVYRCPVCQGTGLVPNGFYSHTSGHWSTTSVSPEKCRTCNGTGCYSK